MGICDGLLNIDWPSLPYVGCIACLYGLGHSSQFTSVILCNHREGGN